MEAPVLSPDPRQAFGQLLEWLMIRGTRPNIAFGAPWNAQELTVAIRLPDQEGEARVVRNWVAGDNLPQKREFVIALEKAFFGEASTNSWSGHLLKHYNDAKRRSLSERAVSSLPPPDQITGRTAESNIQIRLPRRLWGRDEDLAAVQSSLQTVADAVAITLLHGMRGVGKSMLAAAFARRHASAFRVTWWISAQSEPQIRQGLTDLGMKLNWIKRRPGDPTAADRVVRLLETQGHDVLLIFDNAPGIASLRPFIPAAGKCKILVTSNNPVVAGIAHAHHVDVWTPAISADFLLERSQLPNGSRPDAIALAEALGCLPLALEQAGAFCEQKRRPFSDYLDRFNAQPIRFLSDERYASAEYQNQLTVAKTFEIAIEAASAAHPASKPLLMYAALLPPDPIPRFLFVRDTPEEEPQLSEDDFDDALWALRAFALVNSETISDSWNPAEEFEAFRLHRLIKIVSAAQWVDDESRQRAIHLLTHAIAEVYPSDKIFDRHETWPTARALDTHVSHLIAAGKVEPRTVCEISISLVSRFASYRQRTGTDREEVENLWRSNLNDCSRHLGDLHVQTAEMHNNLAVHLATVKGDHRTALTHHQQSYLIRRQAKAPDPGMAQSLRNTASALNALGAVVQSGECYLLAITVAESCDADPVFIAEILSEAAPLFAAVGDFAKSAELLDSALTILRERPDSIAMAECLKNRAVVCERQGRHEDEVLAYRHSLRILENAFKAVPQRTAIARNLLCNALIRAGHLDEALRLSKQSIRSLANANLENEAVAYAYYTVGLVCEGRNRLVWAHRFFEHALTVLDDTIAGPHLEKANIFATIGGVHAAQANHREAIRWHRRALRMRRQCAGANSSAVGHSLEWLGAAYEKLGKPGRAYRLHKLAVATYQRALGPNHSLVQGGKNYLTKMLGYRPAPVVALPSFFTTTGVASGTWQNPAFLSGYPLQKN